MEKQKELHMIPEGFATRQDEVLGLVKAILMERKIDFKESIMGEWRSVYFDLPKTQKWDLLRGICKKHGLVGLAGPIVISGEEDE